MLYIAKFKSRDGVCGYTPELSSFEEMALFLGLRIVENPENGGWIIKQRSKNIAYYTSKWTADEAWRNFCSELPKKHRVGIMAVYKRI